MKPLHKHISRNNKYVYHVRYYLISSGQADMAHTIGTQAVKQRQQCWYWLQRFELRLL